MANISADPIIASLLNASDTSIVISNSEYNQVNIQHCLYFVDITSTVGDAKF